MFFIKSHQGMVIFLGVNSFLSNGPNNECTGTSVDFSGVTPYIYNSLGQVEVLLLLSYFQKRICRGYFVANLPLRLILTMHKI